MIPVRWSGGGFGRADGQMTPASCSSAISSSDRPLSRSTSDVCWPSSGPARGPSRESATAAGRRRATSTRSTGCAPCWRDTGQAGRRPRVDRSDRRDPAAGRGLRTDGRPRRARTRRDRQVQPRLSRGHCGRVRQSPPGHAECRSVLQHRDIVTAIAHGDPALAESAMHSHILAARYTAMCWTSSRRALSDRAAHSANPPPVTQNAMHASRTGRTVPPRAAGGRIGPGHAGRRLRRRRRRRSSGSASAPVGGPPLDELMTTDPTTTPVVIDPATAGPRTNELPLSRDVVVFASP